MRRISAKHFFQLLLGTAIFLNIGTLCMAAIPALPDAYKAKNPQAKVTLLEFSAPWCVTCQMLKPSIKKLTQETGKELNLLEFNIDDEKNKTMVKRYGVIATPTFVVFNSKGQAIKRFDSEVSAGELRKEILKDLGRENPKKSHM